MIEGVAWSVQRIPTAVNFGFLGRSRYFSIQVAPQLSSRGWVDPVPDSLLLRKSGSAGNRSRDLRICSQELSPLDHRGGPKPNSYFYIYRSSNMHLQLYVSFYNSEFTSYLHTPLWIIREINFPPTPDIRECNVVGNVMVFVARFLSYLRPCYWFIDSTK
jgi:hypothetical protein